MHFNYQISFHKGDITWGMYHFRADSWNEAVSRAMEITDEYKAAHEYEGCDATLFCFDNLKDFDLGLM